MTRLANSRAPRNLTVPTATVESYREMIADLERAVEQLESMDRGEGQSLCAICEDNGHTVESCHHNPLIQAVLGTEAMLGDVFRCFHCGAVFTDDESARRHFGDSQDEIVRCLQERAEAQQSPESPLQIPDETPALPGEHPGSEARI